MQKTITSTWANTLRAAEEKLRSMGHRAIGWKRKGGGGYSTKCALCGRVAYLKNTDGLLYFGENKAPLRCQGKTETAREWPKSLEYTDRHARLNPILPDAADQAKSRGHILSPWRLHEKKTVPIAACHCLACELCVVADAGAPEPHQVRGAACVKPCEAAA